VKIKLDVNLGTRGADLLRQRGCDVVTAGQQGMERASDEDLLTACTTEGRALISLDTDFANPLRHPPLRYAGIVVLRTPPRTTTVDVEDALQALLSAVGDAPLDGRLIVVDPGGRVREYRPFES
jgi:predicted nuclease of predicted toxin-antitoxin system